MKKNLNDDPKTLISKKSELKVSLAEFMKIKFNY